MWDPRERVRKYLLWTAILIIFLLVSGIAIGKTTEKVCDTIMYGNCYKDGKLVATKKHECVDCDLNKEVWQSEVADIDKVETILDKIEKIENDKSQICSNPIPQRTDKNSRKDKILAPQTLGQRQG